MAERRLKHHHLIAMQFKVTYSGPDTLSVVRKMSFPVEWEAFSLTHFCGEMERAAVATFANARQHLQPLLDIDQHLIGSAPTIFAHPKPDERAATLLFMRMFSVLRAATRLAMSGQLYESRAVMRSAVECGVYAHAMRHSHELRVAWARRDEDEETRKVARNAFSWSALMKLLRAQNEPLAGAVHHLYDKLIDLGAHPNPGGILGGVAIDEAGDEPMALTLFGGGSYDSILEGIAELAQVFSVCVELLAQSMPERLDPLGGAERFRAMFAISGGVLE